ncbi:MAG: TraR/DksA C4-type zinc finger protein [Acidobacteriota bacterium]|nr:TraR/DksA C4-type zinc finger protein [Acidobacteriota bacterium]
MTEEERQQLKETIIGEIAGLKVEIGRLQEEVKPVAPDRAIGRLTRMEAINAQKMSEANLRKARTRLQALEKTLPRLEEDDEFGICTRCERPIPLKRLMLMPQSRMCVRCAGR